MSFLDNRDYKGVSFRLLCQELTPFSGYDPGKQEVSENRGREDAKRSRINHGQEKISKIVAGRKEKKSDWPRKDKKSQSNLPHDKDSSSWCKIEGNKNSIEER